MTFAAAEIGSPILAMCRNDSCLSGALIGSELKACDTESHRNFGAHCNSLIEPTDSLTPLPPDHQRTTQHFNLTISTMKEDMRPFIWCQS